MNDIVVRPVINWRKDENLLKKNRFLFDFHQDYFAIVSKDHRTLFEDRLFENVYVELNPFWILILHE